MPHSPESGRGQRAPAKTRLPSFLTTFAIPIRCS
jgi:hypothetical protein